VQRTPLVSPPPTELVSNAARTLRGLTGDGWVFDPLAAGVRIPAIAAALALGAIAGRPLVGVLAAGGAFTVGFGVPLRLRRSNALLLFVASLALGAAAVVGSLAAWSDVAVVVCAGGFGMLCGVELRKGPAPAWIALQCALAAVVATTYPATLPGAAKRALVIAAGGLGQTLFLTCAHSALHRLTPPPPSDPEPPSYALHLAAGLAVAAGLARAMHLHSGYWVPLTTLLVLRPGARSTLTRAIARTVGTVGGAALASALIIVLHPSWTILAVLVAAAAFGAYLFQRATYGLLSACITAYVVFILSLTGLPESEVAIARIAATALGGAVGLAVEAAGEMVARARRSGASRTT
jgi:hypothetical protein